ncbi:hypothetical protein V1477_017112 [Vespula maculifrons]|uniref:Uncharacterized protein n=1 Tax=Vespula maculifrons TaxID=7453 RepID=A0ABD2B578_VESMC
MYIFLYLAFRSILQLALRSTMPFSLSSSDCNVTQKRGIIEVNVKILSREIISAIDHQHKHEISQRTKINSFYPPRDLPSRDYIIDKRGDKILVNIIGRCFKSPICHRIYPISNPTL